VIIKGKVSKKIERLIVKEARQMFRLDEGLSQCHEYFQTDETLKKYCRIGAGRLLRSPTLFEDIIKTPFTTNVS
jgi:hypothetical protein